MESLHEYEFVRELSERRGAILEYMRGPSAVFPGLPFVQDFKRDDIGLSAAVAAATERLARARNAQNECSTVRQQCDAAKTEHERCQKALASLYKPLGAAAFAAFKAGEIARQQQFSDRIALDERIAALKKERDALAAPSYAGIVSKAKALALQLALSAKIMAAQLSAGKLDAQIGKRLIDSQSEDSVRSASTDEVLDDVASSRRDITSCKRDFDLAAERLRSAKVALSQALGISQIGGETAVGARIVALQEELATNQRRLRTRERDFLDMLVTNAAGFAETPVGPPLTRLAQLRAEARAVEPQGALANESTSICSDPNSAEFRDPNLLGTPQAPTAVLPQLQRASSLREGFARDREILPQLLGNLNVGDTDNLRSLWDTLSLPSRRVAVFGLLALIAVTLTVIGHMMHEGHTDPGLASDFANGFMAVVATVIAFAVMAVAIAIYFLPAIVATQRKHPNHVAIFLLNLLLGWTVFGWIVALVWSATAIDSH